MNSTFKFDRNMGRMLAQMGGGMVIFPHGMHGDRDGNIRLRSLTPSLFAQDIKQFDGTLEGGSSSFTSRSQSDITLMSSTGG